MCYESLQTGKVTCGMPSRIKLRGGKWECFHILQLSFCCVSLRYYPLELEIAGKNSKLLPLFCQTPVVLQSLVTDTPAVETIKEERQPGSISLVRICVLNGNRPMGETTCKHRQC